MFVQYQQRLIPEVHKELDLHYFNKFVISGQHNVDDYKRTPLQLCR